MSLETLSKPSVSIEEIPPKKKISSPEIMAVPTDGYPNKTTESFSDKNGKPLGEVDVAKNDLTRIQELQSILGSLPNATANHQAVIALLEQNQTEVPPPPSLSQSEKSPHDIDAEISYLTNANRSSSYISDEFKKKYTIDFNGNDAAAYIWIQNKLTELKEKKKSLTNQGTLPQKNIETADTNNKKIDTTGTAITETLPTTLNDSATAHLAIETINSSNKESEAPSNHSEIDPSIIGALKREKELGAPLLQEARMRRNRILEDQGRLQMSKSDFDQLFAAGNFSHHEGMRQQNVGDCYAIAAIHALSQSPHFEMIIRSSLRRLPDGNWEIQIPFLDPQAKTITLSPDEIAPQKNPGFLKRHGGMDGVLPDFRRKLRPMDASEGFQALEAAFIKAKFGKINRLSAEGGWGDDVLLQLGGENFMQYRLDSAKYNEPKKEWEYPGLESLTGEDSLFLDHILEAYDPDVFIVTVSTKHLDTSKISGKIRAMLDLPFYKESSNGKVVVAGHAYSLTGVDKINRTVTLHNPWNTNKSFKLTFDEFKKTFSAVNAVRINNAKILENTKSIHSKT